MLTHDIRAAAMHAATLLKGTIPIFLQYVFNL